MSLDDKHNDAGEGYVAGEDQEEVEEEEKAPEGEVTE